MAFWKRWIEAKQKKNMLRQRMKKKSSKQKNARVIFNWNIWMAGEERRNRVQCVTAGVAKWSAATRTFHRSRRTNEHRDSLERWPGECVLESERECVSLSLARECVCKCAGLLCVYDLLHSKHTVIHPLLSILFLGMEHTHYTHSVCGIECHHFRQFRISSNGSEKNSHANEKHTRKFIAGCNAKISALWCLCPLSRHPAHKFQFWCALLSFIKINADIKSRVPTITKTTKKLRDLFVTTSVRALFSSRIPYFLCRSLSVSFVCYFYTDFPSAFSIIVIFSAARPVNGNETKETRQTNSHRKQKKKRWRRRMRGSKWCGWMVNWKLFLVYSKSVYCHLFVCVERFVKWGSAIRYADELFT